MDSQNVILYFFLYSGHEYTIFIHASVTFSGMDITVTHRWSLSIEVSLKTPKQTQPNLT